MKIRKYPPFGNNGIAKILKFQSYQNLMPPLLVQMRKRYSFSPNKMAERQHLYTRKDHLIIPLCLEKFKEQLPGFFIAQIKTFRKSDFFHT